MLRVLACIAHQISVRWARMQSAASSSSPSVSSSVDVDEYVGEIPVRIDPNIIKRLSRLSPLRSSLHIAFEWTLVVAAAWCCWHFWHPALYVLTVAFIGARQHALVVLAHDAAHYRLFRSHALNDWVGELFLAWPFVTVSVQAYRRNHLPHHRFINTERDPDWVRKQNAEWRFPMRGRQLARSLLLDLTGIGFCKFLVVSARMTTRARSTSSVSRGFVIARLAFLLGSSVAISLLHGWKQYLLFWLVPYITWMQLCFHVRSIAEHFALEGRSGIAQTRTVLTTWFDRVFVLPKNANYHLEHHLYPSVPFYRLPELHRLLLQQPGYRASAHFTRGYLGVLRECLLRG
jgi:fatty acid desaturase